MSKEVHCLNGTNSPRRPHCLDNVKRRYRLFDKTSATIEKLKEYPKKFGGDLNRKGRGQKKSNHKPQRHTLGLSCGLTRSRIKVV